MEYLTERTVVVRHSADRQLDSADSVHPDDRTVRVETASNVNVFVRVSRRKVGDPQIRWSN